MNIFPKKLIACVLTVIMCISSVAFVGATETDAIAVSATETTTILTADCTQYAVSENHNGTGYDGYANGCYALATLDVAEAGYYTLDVKIKNRGSYNGAWDIYVNDMDNVYDSFEVWGGTETDNTVMFEDEVADIYLNQGTNTLKILCKTTSMSYFPQFSLTKKAYDSKAIWMYARNATADSDITTSAGVDKSAANYNMWYIDRNGGGEPYVEYTVNVPEGEAGTYQMSLQHTWNASSISAYTVTVNGSDLASVTALPGVERAIVGYQYANKQVVSPVGELSLTEGDNTVRITNLDAGGQMIYISRLKFDLTEPDTTAEPTDEPDATQAPAGEVIRIPMKSFTNSSSLSRDDLVSFEQGKWAEFEVDIETTGKYRFGMKFGGQIDDTQVFKISVDGVEELNASVAVEHDFFTPGDTEIGEILFTKTGTNVLKIENVDSLGLFVEDFYIQLIEEITITPEPTEEPTEAPNIEPMGENIRLHIKDYTSAYNAVTGLYELAYDGASPDNTKWQVGNWAEYQLNITTPGTYEFGLTLGGNDAPVQKLTASVDGVEQLVADLTITENLTGSQKVDIVFGNVTFSTPGIHTLRIKKTDGSFLYVSHIFLNLTDSSEIRIPTGSYVEANSSRASGALDYEGGYYCLRPGDWAKYNVYIATPGKYKLGIKESGNTGQTAKLKASVNGVEQFNNDSKTPLSGMWAEFSDVEYGEVTFTYAGTNELLIENTGSSDGEYTIDLYLVLVEELDAGTNVPDVPPTTEIRLHMANDSFEKYCNLTGNNALAIEGGCVTWHGKGDSSDIGDWAKFKVNIEDAGVYRFGLELSGTIGANTALRVCVNGTQQIPAKEDEIASQTIKTYYGTLTDTVFGTLEFAEPGEYEIYVEHTGSAGQYVGHIFLTHLGDDLEIIAVKAGDVDLTEESVVSVGTDLIMVSFSKLIKNSDITGEKCKISLKDSKGNDLAISPSVVKGTAVIALKEALKLDETYTLSVGAISDSVENSTSAPAKYTFTTEEGAASAFIRDASASFDGTVATVKATMFSSQNVGIKGRTFEAYVENTTGDIGSQAVATGVSGDDGVIEFTYSLPSGSADGEYTFIISGEYVSADAKADAVYVSEDLRATIENAINAAETAAEVQEIIEQNKEYLGIEPASVVAGLEAPKVYGHFTEKDTTFENIVSDLKKYAAIEKINQATSSNVDTVLADKSNWDAIGIDKSMYDVLSNEQKTVVKNAVIALEDGMTADEFTEAVYDILQESLRADNSKVNLTPDISDMNAYMGQGIYLPIKFTEDYTDVKQLSYTIKVSDDEMLKNADIKLNVPAAVTMDISGDTLTADVVFDSTVSNSNLGNIVLTAPTSTGTYDVTIKGVVNYLFESGDISFVIEANINEKAADVNVIKTPSGGTGNTSSSPNSDYKPSTGGGSSSSGNGSSSVVTPPDEKFAFADLASNHWAYPAVDYLLERGIIEKTADKLFNPETAINREEVVKMLVVALGLTDTTAESSLSDVANKNPYYVYIASAEKLGIIKGNDLGEFMIGSKVTREDICVILHRAISAKLDLTASSETFADDWAISDYAKTAVYEMRGSGLINGMGNNEFAPKGDVTKAQAAKMIYEIVKAVAK